MIPLKLQLKNFLSYGPLQTIDFAAHHLICLSGKNGHGKSALLDAITWALWGQARKVGGAVKADEKLVKLGHDHVMVVFDFMSNNQQYRVRREFSLQGNKSVLDFGIVHPETLAFKPLTDKTIRVTQEKIEAVLGLSYESFVNSAFLRQGQSNEFSKKSPQERKELLSTILGLDRYERARKRALELSRDATQKKAHYQVLINRVVPLIERKSVVEQEWAHGQEQLNKVFQQQAVLSSKQQDVVHKKNMVQHQSAELRIMLMRQAQQQESYRTLHNTLQEAIVQWRQIQRIINTGNEKNYHAEKELCEQELQRLHHAAAQRVRIQEQLAAIKFQLQQQEQQAKDVHSQAESLLERQLQECTLRREQLVRQLVEGELAQKNSEQELISLAAQSKQAQLVSNTLAVIEIKKNGAHQAIEKYGSAYQRWSQRQQTSITLLAQLEQKIMFTCQDNNPTCGLCEQSLPLSQQALLIEKFKREQRFYRHQYQRLARLIAVVKKYYEAAKVEVQQLTAQFEQATIHQQKKMLCDERIRQTEFKKQEQQHVCNQWQQQKKVLDEQHQDLMVQKELLISKAQSLMQEHTEYQQLLLKSRDLEHQESLLRHVPDQLAHAQLKREMFYKQMLAEQEMVMQRQQQSQRRQHITLLVNQLKQLKKELAGYELNGARLRQLHDEQQQLVVQEATCAQELSDVLAHKEQLLMQKTRLEQQKTMISEAEQELQQSQKQLKELEVTSEEYQAIGQAFGKDGIQALLIEHAIPDIEREANAILSRLTDNLAQVSIESLRDLKSGGTKETLDIKISDSVGIRPYELYSGGEAFRIDFALRIAIAKLLARRAGATLQTLIIDEGFGSQDEEGLSNITEALYKIQQDFAKIIIVSHLPTMKEQFPTQFHIFKSPEGSTVRVVQLG